ncbi:hypothetical protein [Stratiformator vulcanicus]|uniref:Uncharacterized protein n=1 Tax=Stratiformator vulcanicus TaxID=2527980 RepID=A0A517R0Q2_9PLAN|nr:hypothetical protein [Stratiformator vulcanicus]QDT37477.1 hypothetical protein Pan189_18570 [Stratiformator vulcanicus]
MIDLYPIAFGLFLVVLGIAFLRGHWKTWQKHRSTDDADSAELKFHRSQFRRRVQTSALIIAIGILIPVGDLVFVRNADPLLFGFFWVGVLVLVIWVVAMAIADIVASRLYTRNAIEDIEQRKRALEQEVAALRRELHTPQRNGRE